MRIVLFGAPGSGKGTQAAQLVEEFSLFHLSTGDVLRRAIREETSLGKMAQDFMDRGALVPDDLVVDIVKDALRGLGKHEGFVLDGFPRTINQAQELEKFLGDLGGEITRVISLEVAEEELVKRISSRAAGSETKRTDDVEKTVRLRLKAFEDQTLPLKQYYTRKNLLSEVCGTGSVLQVYQNVRAAAMSG